ncbi:hypothetical protein A7U60_g2544 [Sanghuangporus baumii]|uniref:Uncharacterized protein n=1 Tax=Sanghuangporus baumii TaxID=108892 RepID=A0A9Q5I2D9_SANBA|nr:hypothetical protein A7U60_g2544 [Sanghuangporus baumii]
MAQTHNASSHRFALRPATFNSGGSGSSSRSVADSDEVKDNITEFSSLRSVLYFAGSPGSSVSLTAAQQNVLTTEGNERGMGRRPSMHALPSTTSSIMAEVASSTREVLTVESSQAEPASLRDLDQPELSAKPRNLPPFGPSLPFPAAQQNVPGTEGVAVVEPAVTVGERYDELESVSAVPIRRTERNMRRRPSMHALPSTNSSIMAEIASSTRQVLTMEGSQAEPASIRQLFQSELACEPLNRPSNRQSLHATSPEPQSVRQPIATENDNKGPAKPKKRRKRAFRLTRVKNERAKKAKTKIEAVGRRTRRNAQERNAIASTAQRTRREPVYAEIDWTNRRMTRAAARAQAAESAGTAHQAEGPTKKDKGKGKAKDEPDSDVEKKSLKRRRHDEDYENADEIPVEQNEPGPSRPVRRTRRRVEENVKLEVPEPLEPFSFGQRGSRGAHFMLRGMQRRRSSAPEPSIEPLEEERRGPRLPTPERFNRGPIATSSHMTLETFARLQEEQNPQAKVEEEEHEVSNQISTPEQHDDEDRWRNGIPPIPTRPRSNVLQRYETTLFGKEVFRPADPDYWRR